MEKEQYPEHIERIIEISVPPGQKPERLDSYITRVIEKATRTKVQKAIESGNVLVNGLPSKASRKIQPNDSIICKVMKPPPLELVPENIPLNIVFEDDYLMVINKPAGMVTHPGYGNRYGTLVNALLWHFGERNSISIESDEDEDPEEELDEGVIFSSSAIRPGIVHRLDKDTSGLLVIAKDSTVLTKLSYQFSERTIDRNYIALVWGNFQDEQGTITGDIGRSPRDRKLFSVVKKGGRTATTDYFVIKQFKYLSLIRLKLHTGRTHQIRVHCNHINHPVFGDPSYNGNSIVYGGLEPQFKKFAQNLLSQVNRQLLHAATLGFIHPITKEFIKFQAEPPEDMKKVIEELEVREEYSVL